MSAFTFVSLFLLLAVQNLCSAQAPRFGRDQPPIAKTVVISSAAETFINAFIRRVDSSPALSDVFSPTMVSVQSFSQFMFSALQIRFYRGSYTPQDLGFSTSALPSEKKTMLTRIILICIFSSASAVQLQEEGILTDANSALLANELANSIETAAQLTVNPLVSESKYQAIVDGYLNFLSSKGLYVREKLSDIANYLGVSVVKAIRGSKIYGGIKNQ